MPALSRPTSAARGLTERYAYAVTRRLPEGQRADVANELRGGIADRAEALTHEQPGLEDRVAERIAIEELGDPDRLAATCNGRPMQLIGPELYPTYLRVLRSLSVVAVPTASVVVGVVTWFAEDSIGAAIGSAAWTGLSVAVHVAFWVTLAFALLERGVGGPDTRSALAADWSPDQLPDLPDQRGSLPDTVGTIAWLGLLGAAVIWQQFRSPITDGDEPVPVLDPDLWSFWLPLVLLLLVAEMVFEVVRYRTATLRPGLNMLIGAAFTTPLVYLCATKQLLNPAAVTELLQTHWAEFSPDLAHALVAVTAIAIWLWDSADGWLRERRKREMR